MKKKITVRQVRSLLAALGKTPDQIAAALKKKKIKGKRYDAGSCPLACYLKRALKTRVSIAPSSFVAGEGDDEVCGNTTMAASVFMGMFDAGAFSELAR